MSSNMRRPLRRRRTASLGIHMRLPSKASHLSVRCLSEILRYSNKNLTKFHMFHFHFEKETMRQWQIYLRLLISLTMK